MRARVCVCCVCVSVRGVGLFACARVALVRACAHV